MNWLCLGNGADETATAFKRAACAATDAFAEYGTGEVGDFAILEVLREQGHD